MPDIALAKLKQHWGYDSFRPLQREAIDCALQKKDSVVVLPTGGGKSLCYQVPALCADGLAVVVSPLISLMKDQVDGLVASGVRAAAINSSMRPQDKGEIANQICSGELDLLYLSPERIVQRSTLDFLKQSQVRFFAIDEAHCISSWGHDFRPEYRQLANLRSEFPDTSVHAFTATATEPVRKDIAAQLNLADAEFLVGDFDRPNLNYRVLRRSDKVGQLLGVVDRFPKQSGIVYCISRREVEDVAATLAGAGYSARPYHAGMSAEDRSANQDAFIKEQINIIVATVAFGMGIDKSNVRYVLHMGMPKSLEAYQQESGRAGRDGLASDCVLLFTGGDLVTWKRMMNDLPPEQFKVSSQLLESMYSYCTRSACRHRMLVEYFGQTLPSDNCGACDCCLGELQSVPDALVVSQKIVSCVHRVGERFGVNHVAAVLTGSMAKRVLQLGHDQLSTYGLLAEHKQAAVADWIEQLVGQQFLAKTTGEYAVLTIPEQGRRMLKGELTPALFQLSQSTKSAPAKQDDWEGVDRSLFDALRDHRREVANQRDIAPFVIFHDTSLRDMARQRPSTVAAFGAVAGVGEKKLADYGESFVTCIKSYCEQHELTMDLAPPKPRVRMASTRKKLANAAKEQAFEMFAAGQSIAEVAEQIGRAASTTSGYLGEYIQAKAVTDPSPWIEKPLADQIRTAASEVGSLERLAPIKEVLGDDFSYEQIRVVVDCLKVETGFEPPA